MVIKEVMMTMIEGSRRIICVLIKGKRGYVRASLGAISRQDNHNHIVPSSCRSPAMVVMV